MATIVRTLADPATYRRLVYLLLGLPLGTIWFSALVTVWSLCLGLVVTPLVIPMLFLLAYMTRGFAIVEAEIARSLLGVDAQAPAPSAPAAGFWARVRALFGEGFWRAQGFLWLRWFVGFPIAVLMLALLGGELAMIVAPLWVPFVHDGADVGFWHPHAFLQSLILVPVGVVLLPLTLLLVDPLAAVSGALASGLLNGSSDQRGRLTSGHTGGGRVAGGPQARAAATTLAAQAARGPSPSARSLGIHAAIDSFVVTIVVVIWALTSSFGYFWPIWVVLPLATALGIHAWFVELGERPELVRRFRGSRALAGASGVATLLWTFLVAIWAVTAHGYFWPIWPLIAFGIVLGALAIAAVLGSPGSAEMAERIETLETSRAGAVDVQDSELRRIERDLHDGAQARLVALGMSLGMAEQKLSEDPDQAGELLAEARVGAEQALRELRDLARGIHPPVLADRGLEAALAALANATPMHVSLAVDVPQRPSSAVESAAYFVAAESLANAAKHARADWLDIRIARVGPNLEVEIRDDGVGGADPNGSGLVGLRRRVQALDGTLEVTSPPGGPTAVYAEMPCG